MIHVRADLKLVFVRGVHRFAEVERAVLEATKSKRWKWREWIVAGIADEDSKTLQTGMPFSPPDDRHEIEGFKRRKG